MLYWKISAERANTFSFFFFQISPDGTDNIRHEGCPRLGPTSSGVRIKIIVKIIPNVKLKGI
jgi:hypothetical protein